MTIPGPLHVPRVIYLNWPNLLGYRSSWRAHIIDTADSSRLSVVSLTCACHALQYPEISSISTVLHNNYHNLKTLKPSTSYKTFHRFFFLGNVPDVRLEPRDDESRLEEGGENTLTLVEEELREVEGEWVRVPTLLWDVTLSGRTNEPCLALHLKYRWPPTVPSCLPCGPSKATPIQIPSENLVSPTYFTVPILNPGAIATTSPT